MFMFKRPAGNSNLYSACMVKVSLHGRTGCGWGDASMCWRRQRGRSVALWRQTPLSSQQRCSCFSSTLRSSSSSSELSSAHDFSGFGRLPVGLKPDSLLNHLFVSPLHEADGGPLIADPCGEKAHGHGEVNSRTRASRSARGRRCCVCSTVKWIHIK